jgi:hypothetical protein
MSRRIGFSTGAIAKGDFRRALEVLSTTDIRVVELSALRLHELKPLCDALATLDLSKYEFVSLHAPSSFSPSEEAEVVRLLKTVIVNGYPVVVHPDVIYDSRLWQTFGDLLLVENMDQRKGKGRTSRELIPIFDCLPNAKMCFDAGHAGSVDSSMSEAFVILKTFAERIAEIHLSSVDSIGHHESFTFAAINAFREIANLIPENVPVILESPVDADQIGAEVSLADRILSGGFKSEIARRVLRSP